MTVTSGFTRRADRPTALSAPVDALRDPAITVPARRGRARQTPDLQTSSQLVCRVPATSALHTKVRRVPTDQR